MIKDNNKPLEKITELIAKGSRSELARLLRVHRSTVSGWDNPKRRPDGMVGTIPDKYLADIVKIAASKGVALTVQDLVAASA